MAAWERAAQLDPDGPIGSNSVKPASPEHHLNRAAHRDPASETGPAAVDGE